MEISAKTKINDLLKAHPFLEDFLVQYNPKFKLLGKRAMWAIVGRVANLKLVASIGEVDLPTFLDDISREIERKTGETVAVGDLDMDDQFSKTERMALLKQVIKDLHDGGDLDEAKEKFALAVGDVNTSEIAQMEEQLIREGLAVEEVQRLCDVHVGAFSQMLDEHDDLKMPSGHPVHTYMEDNRRIETLLDELNKHARKIESDEGVTDEIGRTIEALGGIDNHYTRKENQLFPLLEKYGVTVPPKVMWGVHDEIRGSLKKVRQALSKRDMQTLPIAAAELSRTAAEMIYKEEKVLFPLSFETLTEEDWQEVRRGEDELGYAFAQPGSDWPETSDEATEAVLPAGVGSLLSLDTGALSPEQINLMLTHLPLDISFVDENDEVRYYSGGERHFPRSPAVIGRKVQNCHPPGSVHIVERILNEFKAGKKNTAEFWIQLHGKFLHIRYFALRDADGTYRGCLEAGQDITEIRQLEGEQRLLNWEKGGQDESKRDNKRS